MSKKNKKKKSKARKKIKKSRSKTRKKFTLQSEKELIIKTSKAWSKQAYVNKKSYEKNIIYLSRIMKIFGGKKEKELRG